MSDNNNQLSLIDQYKRRACLPYTDEERRDIIEALFEYSADGNSLEAGSKKLNVALATVLRWIKERPDWESRYENLKITRSRALIERALGEIDQEHDSFSVKIAETRARMFVKVAGLINPGEFSERAQAALHKATGNNRAVSFVLNFGGEQQPANASMTITVQPEDGE